MYLPTPRRVPCVSHSDPTPMVIPLLQMTFLRRDYTPLTLAGVIEQPTLRNVVIVGDRTCDGSDIGLNKGSMRIMSFLSRVVRVMKRKSDVSVVLLIVSHPCSRCCSRQSNIIMFSIITLNYVDNT